MKPILRPWLLVLALAACTTASPPPTTYVLGTPAAVTDQTVETLVGRPIVEVKPVLVPDYLDTTDILVRRSDNVVAPSPTGRWGERLSIGITRMLGAGLGRRLPDLIVATTTPVDQPARQVLVDVESFEVRAGSGVVVLIARWRVLDGQGGRTLAGERVSLPEQLAGPGDDQVVQAMTRAVDTLIDRIAAGIQANRPRAR